MPTNEFERHAAGAVIRRLRFALAITSRELARRTNISAIQMSRTENGLRALKLDEANEIAKVFGITIEDFWVLIDYESKKGEAFYRKMKAINHDQALLLVQAIRG